MVTQSNVRMVKRNDVVNYLLDQVNNGRPLTEQLKRLISKLYYEKSD